MCSHQGRLDSRGECVAPGLHAGHAQHLDPVVAQTLVLEYVVTVSQHAPMLGPVIVDHQSGPRVEQIHFPQPDPAQGLQHRVDQEGSRARLEFAPQAKMHFGG